MLAGIVTEKLEPRKYSPEVKIESLKSNEAPLNAGLTDCAERFTALANPSKGLMERFVAELEIACVPIMVAKMSPDLLTPKSGIAGGGATGTNTLSEAWPPAPEQEIVKVVLITRFPKSCEPEVG